MAEKRDAAQRAALTANLPGWEVRDSPEALVRRWRFRDFSEAWGFMARVALLAERHDHHPTWSNTYGTVEILLTTHDADGLTERDIRLAQAIDRLAPQS